MEKQLFPYISTVTILSSWPIPHIDSELNRFAGSIVFATFDLSQLYWQLALDPDLKGCQSFIKPEGAFTTILV
jgi:hypothetical protein